MSNMDQRIARIENLIVSQVDSNFNNPAVNETATPEISVSNPSNNQVIPNHSSVPPTPASSVQMDLQAEIRNMQQTFGGEIASALSQMKTFLGQYAPLSGNPDNSSSSTSNQQ